jgi:hypothetical protein
VLYTLIYRGIDIKFSFWVLSLVLICGDQGGECWSWSPRLGHEDQIVLSHALIEGVTLFLWAMGPRRQRPIRGTQNKVHRDLTTPTIGSDSLVRTAAGRLHCLHRYGIASSSSTTSSPKPPEPSSPTPALTLDRVRQQALRFVLLLPKIEPRLKIYFNTLRPHSTSVNPSRSLTPKI